MLLLEQIEERARERADERFDLFLEELERQLAAPQTAVRNWSADEVRFLLLTYRRPSIAKLRKAAKRLGLPEFDALIDEWSEVLVMAGLSAYGSGGYHALYNMPPERLGDIERRANSVSHKIMPFYRRYVEAAQFEFARSRGRGVVYLPVNGPLWRESL